MLAALAGGAALMGRGKGIGTKETISDAQKAHNFAAAKSALISKKDVLPKTKVDTGPVLNVTGGIHANKPAKGMMFKNRPPKNIMHPIYGQHRTPPGGMRTFTAKKGGRVTGAAKRGFGRALMKGKK